MSTDEQAKYRAVSMLEDGVWRCLEAGLTEDEIVDRVADAVREWDEDDA